MRFVLFVEGDTEKKALPDFLRKCLAPPALPKPVGVTVVKFQGAARYCAEVSGHVKLHLSGKKSGDVIAGIGLLDLYGLPFAFPRSDMPPSERYSWAQKHLQDTVGHPRFRQHFAMHETEAWLLSQPERFPKEVQGAFPGKCDHPEAVNFDEPPAKLLHRLYRAKLGRSYDKVLDGHKLFKELAPETALGKCPKLKLLVNDMLDLASKALP